MELSPDNLGIVLRGDGVSDGIVLGAAYLWDRDTITIEHVRLPEGLIEAEVTRFHRAVERAEAEIDGLYESLTQSGMSAGDHLGLLDAHKMMLRDPMILGDTDRYIREEHLNAEWALAMTQKRVSALFASMTDPFFRERGEDVTHIIERLHQFLAHREETGPLAPTMAIPSGSVLVARALSPTEAIAASRMGVAAFALDAGSSAGHTAIVARSLGVPAVVGIGNASDQVGHGDRIIVDGSEGEIIVHPSTYEELQYERRSRRHKAVRRTLQQNRALPARTPDNFEITLRGNVDFIAQADRVAHHGGQGIGLFRTEFLFLERSLPPTEDEQYAVYTEILKALEPAPVTIRTLDVGGDKELKYLGEDAKGQGLRAIRYCLANEGLFLQQLRALLRAAVHGELRMLLPFISTLHEIREVKRLLKLAATQLDERGLDYAQDVPLGIMIEVPAAALAADLLSREVDFFSVGTNDLLQYTMAVSREANVPDYLSNPLQPGFLRLLQMITRAARTARIPVAMCGEMAGKARYTPLLLALGFNELSMSPDSIPLVKEVIRRTERTEALALFQTLMGKPEAGEAKDYLDSYMVEHFPDIVIPKFRGAPHYMR